MRSTLGLCLLFGDRSGIGEILVDLVVELLPVGDDDEGPVAGNLTQHLLGEEDHRDALAAPLRVPEDAQLALVVPCLLQRLDGVVDAEELVVLGQNLDQPTLRLHEEGEILDQIEQPFRLAGATDHRLQRDDALLPLAVDLLPVVEVLPGGGDAADLALAAVGEDQERVVPEEMRDRVLVVAQVVVEGALDWNV